MKPWPCKWSGYSTNYIGYKASCMKPWYIWKHVNCGFWCHKCVRGTWYNSIIINELDEMILKQWTSVYALYTWSSIFCKQTFIFGIVHWPVRTNLQKWLDCWQTIMISPFVTSTQWLYNLSNFWSGSWHSIKYLKSDAMVMSSSYTNLHFDHVRYDQ